MFGSDPQSQPPPFVARRRPCARSATCWRYALPFLSADTAGVLVNLSLVVGAVANGAYVAHDSGWFKPSVT